MKTSWLLLSVFVLNPILPFPNNSQNLKIYQIIGKKMDYVVSYFGKPAHQDRSNKEMQCVFYKTDNSQSVFVANKAEVFQAECSKTFDSKSAADNELISLIKGCKNEGYEIDTLNISEYNMNIPRIKINVSLFENNFSKKYEIKVKANKSVGLK
ncbi:MAG: hypothetical protein HYS24_04180 [Ignavibacteriales bacterium]|nr:hypothetical protein [Ignavibacteriales bacterium]